MQILALSFAFAQPEEKSGTYSPYIDSLFKNPPKNFNDTNAVNYYQDLCYELSRFGDYTKANDYCDKSIEIAREIDFKKGVAQVLNTYGVIHYHNSELDSALMKYDVAVEYCKEHEVYDVLGITYLNISNIYSERSDFPTTLEYLYQARNIFDKKFDPDKMGGILVNIGIVYFYMNNLDTALIYYQSAEKIYDSLQSDANLSYCYMNIGAVYAYQDKLIESIKYFKKSLALKIKMADKNGMCLAYQNIAEMYAGICQYPLDSIMMIDGIEYFKYEGDLKTQLLDTAKNYLQISVGLAKEINNKFNLLSGLTTLASIYNSEGNTQKAIEAMMEGKRMAIELQVPQSEMDAYEHLYELYNGLAKYDSALKYFKKATILKDSIFSQQRQKDIGKIEAKYDYDKQRAIENAVFEKQLAIDQANLRRQKLMQGFLVIIIIFILGFVYFIYQALQRSKKQQTEIASQKDIIEKKNLEILSSIRYASRIQSALLKEEEHITPELPEHFIFFQPRDIVSGDFYWSVKQDNFWYLAVADCTGHGVPGAFLTMLGTAYLNEIVSSDHLKSPAKILEELREKVVNQLSQSENVDDSKDGMDITLICLDLKTGMAKWAGANNPIYIVRPINGTSESNFQNSSHELIEYKGDKQPIGFHEVQKDFTLHEFELKKGDMFYLISDGFPDQFGGPNNKKYRYKPFKNLLLNISKLKIEDQKKSVEKEFEDWKGNHEQLDDVCVIGVHY